MKSFGLLVFRNILQKNMEMKGGVFLIESIGIQQDFQPAHFTCRCENT